MGSANIDPAAILNRALEYAAQNLRVEKLLIQLGLDPANISYDVVFNRLDYAPGLHNADDKVGYYQSRHCGKTI